MLTFTITTVREVIARGIVDAKANGGFRDPYFGLSAADNRKPGLWIVGDHGVYLCSNGELAKGATPLVAYAEECDPHRNDDWFEVKRWTFGGDDGVDFLDAEGLEALIAASPGCTHLRIAFLQDTVQLCVIERR
ncbi:DUF3085 domain-containing protein [Phyllobacterium sp. YR531]|uniref:DUF3085 domain-containing protein n=1 Tax=Phyllobacterium sp. YR531 TaxID=1144343 RepID=UPI00026FCBAF|nr:DUF3085 domain-containing protein [Phyllobacterium sp. YR531]EJN06849.1 Protein of unknown function (DUF3085) [Phyllobacterium sp. YR531]